MDSAARPVCVVEMLNLERNQVGDEGGGVLDKITQHQGRIMYELNINGTEMSDNCQTGGESGRCAVQAEREKGTKAMRGLTRY